MKFGDKHGLKKGFLYPCWGLWWLFWPLLYRGDGQELGKRHICLTSDCFQFPPYTQHWCLRLLCALYQHLF